MAEPKKIEKALRDIVNRWAEGEPMHGPEAARVFLDAAKLLNKDHQIGETLKI